MKSHLFLFCAFTLCVLGLGGSMLCGGDKEGQAELSNGKPLTPREEQMTFRTLPGLHVELVACEPQVVDPVALAFDEKGRLYVAEMHGYPNEGVGTGNISSGKIRQLEDKDGDGFFETSTVYADNLRLPTGVMPYKGGLIVCNAPDIVYFEDTDNDGKADKQRVLYTGFDLGNIQQMVNSLQWGLDNWVHGCAGGKGGEISSPEKPGSPTVTLRGRGIRFHPNLPASLEPTSGGGQFGLAADEWGQWFTNTNSQHLRHIVLPDHYLQRNPLLPVKAVTIDIPDHGAACKVNRISPFEAWRVVRTKQRKDSPTASKFPTTELIPGGFSTSTCSPLIYLADLLPKKYHGNSLVCDPANNLIHRDVLEPKGATFVGKRADADCEFFASTDNFCRPVNMTIGPDGAIYFADFYREVIETPLSLPPDIKAKVNLQSRKRGRIWKIVPDGKQKVVRPQMHKETAVELVSHLASPNIWWRMTAQRLLIERQDKAAVKPLENLVHTSKYAPARMHALWALHGLHALGDAEIELGLKDPEAGVREQALRLAEERLDKSAKLRQIVAAMVNDPSFRVRFQLAFTLGQAPTSETAKALAMIALQDAADPWMQTAVLSSAHGKMAPELLKALAQEKNFTTGKTGQLKFVTQLAALVGTAADESNLEQALKLLATEDKTGGKWQMAFLEGLAQGLQRNKGSLAKLWDSPPAKLKNAVQATLPFFHQAGKTAQEEKATLDDRLTAIRLLGFGPFQSAAPILEELIDPQQPQKVQLGAVASLSSHSNPQVGAIFLKHWTSYSPEVRREVVNALFAEKGRVLKLLSAIEAKKVPLTQLEPARIDLLKKYPDAKIRNQAQKLLKGVVAADRQKVIEKYMSALELKPDAARGKTVFKKTCATCHRLENIGFETGPDLVAVLGGKSAEDLLTAILDPNREVDPRYLEYIVVTKAGKITTGRIMVETATSITLRRAENAEETILRSDIDSVQATARSLMPEGLESQLMPQDLADLIAYLQKAGKSK